MKETSGDGGLLFHDSMARPFVVFRVFSRVHAFPDGIREAFQGTRLWIRPKFTRILAIESKDGKENSLPPLRDEKFLV